MNTDILSIIGLIVTLITAVASIFNFTSEIRTKKIFEILASERIKSTLVFMISFLIDLGSLAFWVLIQWGANTLVFEKLDVIGVDRWILTSFIVIFGISTLIPIVIYIYVDVRTAMIRRQKSNVQAKLSENANGNH
jgi:hypothetical protein